jgi:hypothetical protein
MNISLTPKREQLVSDKVKADAYQSPSEVIGEAQGRPGAWSAVFPVKPRLIAIAERGEGIF